MENQFKIKTTCKTGVICFKPAGDDYAWERIEGKLIARWEEMDHKAGGVFLSTSPAEYLKFTLHGDNAGVLELSAQWLVEAAKESGAVLVKVMEK